MCETSEHAHRRIEFATDLEFLFHFHAAGKRAALEACDDRIFVYRDPLQRAVSVFVDKFVVRNGNRDIFVNFQSVSGIQPDAATFDLFVLEYLSKSPLYIDPHCIGQSHHLLPLLYTEAIPLASLSKSMRRIIGDDLAARFFLEKTNSIAGPRFDTPSHDIAAGALHQRFRQEGETPSHRSLLTEPTVQILRKVYRDDLNLLARLSRAGGGEPRPETRVEEKELA
jgi:hypothetical protein